jgi:thiamine-monophosphate kinase
VSAPGTPPGSGPLGPGREFDLIRALTAGLDPTVPGVITGPGDDAAVLDGGWVLTCDLCVEGVHFRRDWMHPESAGGRAVRAALSDLAAMAAEPVGILMALGGSPEDHRAGHLEALGRGARAAAGACGAAVLGGDVTRSPGPLVVDITAIGRSEAPLRRSGARPGHELWVTGRLGGAAAAIRLLRRGMVPPPLLQDAHLRPTPRLAEARWLAGTGEVSALMDLSDGLAGDAGHLAAASRVEVEVDADAVPVGAEVLEQLDPPEALAAAVSGGEDYELLFTAAPSFSARRDDFLARFPGVHLTRIGAVHGAGREGPRVTFWRRGRPWTPPDAFDHFGGPGQGGG